MELDACEEKGSSKLLLPGKYDDGMMKLIRNDNLVLSYAEVTVDTVTLELTTASAMIAGAGFCWVPGSAEVDKWNMPAACGWPRVKPDSVIVRKELVGIVPAVVIMIAVVLVAAVADREETFDMTVGAPAT